jgi:hypothetical protein
MKQKLEQPWIFHAEHEHPPMDREETIEVVQSIERRRSDLVGIASRECPADPAR